MDCLYLECKNFRDFAEKDRISALLFCEVLNLNFDYFYDFDKQTSYVDGWAFDDIYVFQSVQDLALEYLHRGIEQKSVFINGRYRNIPDAIEYVALDKFGNKLLDEFGDDSFQLLPNGKVVAIGCGW